MLVEFVRQHLQFAPGRVADLAGGVADTLIRRGVARPLPAADAPAQAVPEPPAVEPAEDQPKAKKKGK